MPCPIQDALRYLTWIACMEAPAEVPETCRSPVGPVSYLQAKLNVLNPVQYLT